MKFVTVGSKRVTMLAILMIAWGMVGMAYAQSPAKALSGISYPVQLEIERCRAARVVPVNSALMP